ncbi:DUF4142 domain-containing protein [Ramlibacter tataouinensis]|uniref:DUF4142 domain-containing protein n=1 Tax=Ramlibacter tataouinensis (strain ATCC BAA-407 / DSM 14655 / LMG 21543 / TTB310) TaxID=365046 RepID=F5Y2L6_RAMTT|nr:DUF4142 domain-containing protein [Ramlibacter tataouinensis]AEG92379.1 conserved hypothetical protein [Ramlibacter tataouinensis TTB310]
MNSKRLTHCAAAVLALGLSLGTAWAQSSSSGTSAGGAGTGSSASGGAAAPRAQPGTGARNDPASKDKSEQLARADRKFIEDAAASGMFEVQAAQLAVTKASSPAVKDYASMLVDHHSAANNELIQMANSKGVELPPAPPRSMRKQVEDMGKKSGQEFDRDFVRTVGIKAHEKDVKMFQKASQDAKDPQLKAWAAKTLPTLQQHLAQAQKLPQAGRGNGGDAARMGNTSGGGAATGNTGGGAATGSTGTTGANKTGS